MCCFLVGDWGVFGCEEFCFPLFFTASRDWGRCVSAAKHEGIHGSA